MLNNILTRSFTGAIFVLLIVTSILIGSITFYLTFSIIVILSMLEFYNLSNFALANPQKWLGIFTGWLFFTVNYFYAFDFIHVRFFIVFIPIVILFFINELYLFHKRPFTSLAYSFLGIIYIAVPFSFLNYFVFRTNINILDINDITNYEYLINQNIFTSQSIYYTPYLLLGFFILIWIYDTFAYLTGILIGKHRLFERISPKKSWEGTIGGAIFTIGLSTLFPYFINILEWYQWLMFSVLIVVFSTYGDLVESLFKRSLNIKDSGKMLPGHGGILDRFDSVLIASPIIYIYLQFLN
ncbi:MAG: hypothetical protein A2X08_07630 [Bacteroidetes bacterium GWA2_32_17]|nr:MAG: hypothetical protein A2X08_07630 [Bacteroidetes bacterium GWA2_32_17]